MAQQIVKRSMQQMRLLQSCQAPGPGATGHSILSEQEWDHPQKCALHLCRVTSACLGWCQAGCGVP